MTPLRIVFMGTPDFAVPTLNALIAAGHTIAAVYTQPSRPAGRGQKPRPSPVQQVAEEAGIDVRTPKSLKSEDAQQAFAALKADIAVVAAYGFILPDEILAAPRLGCINLHASLLPRWRGAAPIQRAIMAGDGESGITVMVIDQGLDTGPILLQEAIRITADMTAGDLHDIMAERGGDLICQAIAGLADGRLQPVPQGDDGATYAKKIGKDEGRLDWSRPADELAHLIRGLSPYPGAWFEHERQRIKVLRATAVPGTGDPGQVLDEGLTVACGAGALKLTRLQRAGRAVMTSAEFLRGFPLAAGTRIA